METGNFLVFFRAAAAMLQCQFGTLKTDRVLTGKRVRDEQKVAIGSVEFEADADRRGHIGLDVGVQYRAVRQDAVTIT